MGPRILRNNKVLHPRPTGQATRSASNLDSAPRKETLRATDAFNSTGFPDNQEPSSFSPSEGQISETKNSDKPEILAAMWTILEGATHPSLSTGPSLPETDPPYSSATTHQSQQEAPDPCQLALHPRAGKAAGSLDHRRTTHPKESSTLGEGELPGVAMDRSPSVDSLTGVNQDREMDREESGLMAQWTKDLEAQGSDEIPSTPLGEYLDVAGDERPYPPDSPVIAETPLYLQTRLLSLLSDQSRYLVRAKAVVSLPEETSGSKKKPASSSKSSKKPSSKKPELPPVPESQESPQNKSASGSKSEAKGEGGSQGDNTKETREIILDHLQRALNCYIGYYAYNEEEKTATRTTNKAFKVSEKKFVSLQLTKRLAAEAPRQSRGEPSCDKNPLPRKSDHIPTLPG